MNPFFNGVHALETAFPNRSSKGQIWHFSLAKTKVKIFVYLVCYWLKQRGIPASETAFLIEGIHALETAHLIGSCKEIHGSETAFRFVIVYPMIRIWRFSCPEALDSRGIQYIVLAGTICRELQVKYFETAGYFQVLMSIFTYFLRTNHALLFSYILKLP